MRALAQTHNLRALAADYGVSRETIWMVVHRAVSIRQNSLRTRPL